MLLWKNKTRKKTRKKQNQVMIDGLLENHVGLAFVCERRTWEILPWISFNPLISRLSTSLCMVYGHYCISLKTKSWREASYCVKKENYLFVLFLTNGYLVEETETRSTHWRWLLWHRHTFASLLEPDHYQQLQMWKDAAACNRTWTSCIGGWIDSWIPRRTLRVENRCKTTPVVCKW